jgi:outer membrane protein
MTTRSVMSAGVSNGRCTGSPGYADAAAAAGEVRHTPPGKRMRRGGFAHHPRLASLALLFLAIAAITPATHAETARFDADGAVARALAVSHTTAAAAERVDVARSSVSAANAARLPTVSAAAAVQELSSVPEFAAAIHGQTEPPVVLFPDIRTDYSFSLGLRQALYAGGAVTSARSASRHELTAAEQERRSVHNALVLTARQAYWQAAAADAAVGTAESRLRRAERFREDARALRAAGMAVNADVLAADARAAAARLAVIRARTAADDAMAALRSLLQLPSGGEVELADAMPASLPPEPEPLAALQEEARVRRPDLAAVAARTSASAANTEVVRAGARPSLGAVAQWDLARPNQRYLPLENAWHDSWSVGLSANLTVWDGGRTRADVAVAQAQQRALSEELADLQRRVDLDVEQRRLQLASALAAVPAADASRQAAEARLTAVDERFRAGLATSVDVLEAEADLTAAETEQVDARTSAWIAAARLDWAVGR